MFHSIEGKLIEIEPNENEYIVCIKTNSGIAFEIKTTHKTAMSLNQKDENVLLHTYFAVKEGGVDLYGFYDKEEKNIFKLLITVSGVGPKAALSILSNLTPIELSNSIARGDVNTINSCKGIGPKTAQRIVLELKDKFNTVSLKESDISINNTDIKSEAIGALMALGYSKIESQRAISSANDIMSVEELIRYGLKNLQN